MGKLVETYRDTGREVARRLFLDRHVELWLAALDIAWSPSELRARVVEVVRETEDVRTFVLQPPRRWPGHRAGQHTIVEVEVDGARLQRCYSLASAPGDSRLAITVKRVPGGRVSGWLHDRVRAGDVLRLREPTGDFVLPEGAPGPLLFLSGGSGITPIASMLRELAARGATRDVVLVHHARHRDDVIFGAELEALAARHAWLRCHVLLDDAPGAPTGFDEGRLAALVPDLATRDAFACGPPGMTVRVEAMWSRMGCEHRLHLERFTLPVRDAAPSDGRPVTLRLERSGRTIVAASGETLLSELERAGERPRSGCRMGICRSCTTRKRAGVVQNVLTREVSSAPDEDIQLCVSSACSDVDLAL